MHFAVTIFTLVLLCVVAPATAQDAVFESVKAAKDIELSTDSSLPFWKAAHPIYAEKGPYGDSREHYRTEIRSRWTEKNLYVLFVCPYQQLNLNPSPNTAAETFRLWDWDVAEMFIGSDFQNIRRYKEFEVSPQQEWIDLDIDLAKPHHEDGWTWNSGFIVSARIDAAAKVWYAAMRIPLLSLQSQPPAAGQTFRVNFFRSQGPEPNRVQVVWQPTMSNTFHTPEKFGLLRLMDAAR